MAQNRQRSSRNNKNQGQRRSGGDNRSSSRRRNNSRRSGGNRTQSRQAAGGKNNSTVTKYLNLLEQHFQVRRKYYDKFDRVSAHERKSLEKKFFNTIEQIRTFEESLGENQKKELFELTERYPLDTTYSSNHELPVMPPEEELPPIEGDFEDPHLSQQQKSRPDYSQDSEETEGSMDDYLAYKQN